jgi:hypothetical protein
MRAAQGEQLMTTDLSGALSQGGNYKKTELKIGYGAHKAYFIGLGETVTEQSTFPCRVCKGSGNVRGATCFACSGSGRKTTTKVPIQYRISPTDIQEEWVTFVVTEPGKLQDGTPKSGSTLWARLKALSGISDPAQITAWYGALPKPIKIPVEIMIVDNDAGTGCVIASVKRLGGAAPSPTPTAPAPAPAAHDDEYSFPETPAVDEDEVPF